MQCRACGTEIADKAIVCFRCGAPTMEPAQVGASGGSTRQRTPWLAWLVAALFVAAAAGSAVFGSDELGPRLVIGATGLLLAGGAWWFLGGRGGAHRAG